MGKCLSRRAVNGSLSEGVVLKVRTYTCASSRDVRGWCSAFRGRADASALVSARMLPGTLDVVGWVRNVADGGRDAACRPDSACEYDLTLCAIADRRLADAEYLASIFLGKICRAGLSTYKMMRILSR